MLALVILIITPVHGKVTMVNKELLQIENCYNVTIHYQQESGNVSDLTFTGCKNLGNYTWTCDCRYISEYNLTMSSDGAILKKPRVYEFDVQYRTYDIIKFSDTFTVKDYGYEIDISGMKTEELGKDIEYIETIVYVNQTVYKDKIVNRTVEVIKEVPVDNLTTITRLNGDITELRNNNTALSDSNKHLKSANKWLWITLILLILIAGWLTYLAW